MHHCWRNAGWRNRYRCRDARSAGDHEKRYLLCLCLNRHCRPRSAHGSCGGPSPPKELFCRGTLLPSLFMPTPLCSYSISKSRWKREGKRAATRQYNEYGEALHSVADKVNA
jgi:hypothetical protein